MSERFRNVANIWSWLPAFRAVAETEHLPTASEMMNVTPPALSRTIKNLEDVLGYTLFDREGRTMKLNENGQRLLGAVRESMRRVDDAMEANRTGELTGVLRWTSNWSLSGLVLSGLKNLVTQHPKVLPRMLPLEEGFPQALLRGDLDIAIITGTVNLNGINATEIGPVPHSVYCGKGHPLYKKKDVKLDDVAGQAFAAPVQTLQGMYEDGWPSAAPRKVEMEFSQMSVGFRACRDHGLLAVLPDDVGRDEKGLKRLVGLDASPTAYALHRTSIRDDGPVELFVKELQRALKKRA